MESEALRHGRKLKRQDEDRTDWECEEPSEARKRLSQEQQDVSLQSEQPVKEQLRKPWEERPRQLKILGLAQGPQEQAVTGRTSDGGKGP